MSYSARNVIGHLLSLLFTNIMRESASIIFPFLSFSECDEEYPCQGLGEHAHFKNFGMAFLTLFRVATGDNWNGIMKVCYWSRMGHI